MASADEVHSPGWVVVADGLIESVGGGPPPDELPVIARGDLVMPGLVSAHQHAVDLLVAGGPTGPTFLDWLLGTYHSGLALAGPDDCALAVAAVRAATLAAGVTTMVDCWSVGPVADRARAEACADASIEAHRASGGRTVFGVMGNEHPAAGWATAGAHDRRRPPLPPGRRDPGRGRAPGRHPPPGRRRPNAGDAVAGAAGDLDPTRPDRRHGPRHAAGHGAADPPVCVTTEPRRLRAGRARARRPGDLPPARRARQRGRRRRRAGAGPGRHRRRPLPPFGPGPRRGLAHAGGGPAAGRGPRAASGSTTPRSTRHATCSPRPDRRSSWPRWPATRSTRRRCSAC